jgi:hypothetical protein
MVWLWGLCVLLGKVTLTARLTLLLCNSLLLLAEATESDPGPVTPLPSF